MDSSGNVDVRNSNQNSEPAAPQEVNNNSQGATPTQPEASQNQNNPQNDPNNAVILETVAGKL